MKKISVLAAITLALVANLPLWSAEGMEEKKILCARQDWSLTARGIVAHLEDEHNEGMKLVFEGLSGNEKDPIVMVRFKLEWVAPPNGKIVIELKADQRTANPFTVGFKTESGENYIYRPEKGIYKFPTEWTILEVPIAEFRNSKKTTLADPTKIKEFSMGLRTYPEVANTLHFRTITLSP